MTRPSGIGTPSVMSALLREREPNPLGMPSVSKPFSQTQHDECLFRRPGNVSQPLGGSAAPWVW